MNDYIKIPFWIPNQESIKSSGIKNFFDDIEIIDNQYIDLSYLRKIYSLDKEKFFELLSELAIRGFEFHSSKSNNVLPQSRFKVGEYVLSNPKSELEQLEFEALLIGDIKKRYAIEEANFFDYIPLEGFKYLNANIDEEKLKNQFLKGGFDIHKFEGNTNFFDDEAAKNMTNYFVEKNIEISPRNPLYLVKESSIKIEVFFKKNGIYSCEDFTNELVIAISKEYGIGTSKMNKLIQILIDFYLANYSTLNLKYSIHEIDFWFYDDNFSELRSWCKSKSIANVNEITRDVLKEFAVENDINNHLFRKVVNQVESYRVNIVENKIQSPDEKEENFIVLMKQISVNLAKLLVEEQINSIEQIDNEFLILLGQKKFFGISNQEKVIDFLTKIYLDNYRELNFNYDITHIDFWFSNDKFKIFRSWCEGKNHTNIIDITKELVEETVILKVVSKSLAKNILTIVDKYKQFNIPVFEQEPKQVMLKEFWYQKIGEIKLEKFLNVINIEKTLSFDTNVDLQYLQDNFEEFDSEEKKYISNIFGEINAAKSFTEIADVCINDLLSLKEREILFSRYAEGLTLDETGKQQGVTRERIRQIQKKAVKKVIALFNTYNFNNTLHMYFPDKSYISINELYDVTELNTKYIMSILIESEEFFLYYETLDMIIFKDFFDIENKIKGIVIKLPQIFKMFEYLDFIVSELESFGIRNVELADVEKILQENKYKFYGEYASKKPMTMQQSLELIFKNHILAPIRIDSDGCNKIRKYAKQWLDISLTNNDRAIEARIRDVPDLILVDKLTMIYIENLEIDISVLSKIKYEMDRIFLSQSVINTEQIYNSFQLELNTAGITNKIMLYSLLKQFYSEDYKIGKGNTLNIYRDDNVEQQNSEEIVIEIIGENKKGFIKDDVLKTLNWSSSKLENCIANSQKIVKLQEKIYNLELFDITDEQKQLLYEITNKLIDDKEFTTSPLIYTEVMFDNRVNGIIKDIDNHQLLAIIIKKMFKDIKGYNTFITNKNSKFESIEQIIANKFENIHDKKEIQSFLEEIGYNNARISKSICSIVENNIFIEISQEELINAKNYGLSGEVKEATKAYIDKEFSTREFLVLTDLSGYRNVLPKIAYDWNAQILRNIAIESGYREIKRMYDDVTTPIVIIVKEDSPFVSYADLIYYLIKYKYQDTMKEVAIYDFLVEQGVVRRQQYISDKKIPHDLKRKNIIKIDVLGNCELIEPEGEASDND